MSSEDYYNEKDSRILGIIMTEPSGAQVIVDGEHRGTSPISLILPRGKHAIKVAREGYRPVEEIVDWQSERVEEVKLTLLRKISLF